MIKNVNETMKHPRMLLWFLLVPQLLLLLLNGRAWRIVHGEMNPEQLQHVLWIGLYQAALLLAGAAGWAVLRWLKRPVPLALCAVILLAGIGYLWLFTANFERLIPATIADWMLPGSQILYYQYALIMPALFYAGLRLACFPARLGKAADVGASLAAVVAIPLGWYVGLRVFDSLWRFVDPAVWVILTLAVGSTVILLIAFLRILTYAYTGLAAVSWGRPVMLFTAGLVAPIGGLLLNRKIPFPYDFQSQSVYVLTCLNALLLLLPFTDRQGRSTLVWALRCMTYPFSLYFFVVFLPFLPLSLPAMIAAGAGFLILAPTLLFIVHTRTLIEEGAIIRARLGTVRVLALFVACAALIPLALTGRALLDRQALTRALDAAYRPDYASGLVQVNRPALKRTLNRLHDIKYGIYMPFITDGYDALVLDGMILPDRKIEHMEILFFGKPSEREKPDGMFTDIFNPASARRRERNQNRVRTTPRSVQLTGTECHTAAAGDTTTTTLALTLQNNSSEGAEYVTDITLPVGVFITGYWLHIGEERVPGRIFEKKAAMWVYHMIRDQTRRDPGMLVYAGEDTVRLSVFPFAAAETRTTEIAFSYPTGMSPRVQIGERVIDLESPTPAQPTVFLHREVNTTGRQTEDRRLKTEDKESNQPRVIDTSATTLLIPAATAAALPAVTRAPYIHFIVDCSERAASAYAGFAERIERIRAQVPGIDRCQITLANYEFTLITSAPVPLADAASVIVAFEGRLPFRGALCPERAIKSALLSLRDNPEIGDDNLPMVPVFVIVKAADSPLLREEDGFGPFADIAPDMGDYYAGRPDGQFDAYPFRGAPTRVVSAIPPPRPSILLRAGTTYATCPADRASVVRLPADASPECYDITTGGFRPLERMQSLPGDSLTAQGLGLMRTWEQTQFNPFSADSARPELLARSRASGILLPTTAYIVVENSAQWDMLQRAEAKSLKADSKLEFDEFIESPAPPMLLLLPVVFLLPVLRRRRHPVCRR